MVVFEVTKWVQRHRVNQDYPCVKVTFDLKVDDHVRVIEDAPLKLDWLPRDDEGKEFVILMVKNSPTFLAWLREFMANLGPREVAAFI